LGWPVGQDTVLTMVAVGVTTACKRRTDHALADVRIFQTSPPLRDHPRLAKPSASCSAYWPAASMWGG